MPKNDTKRFKLGAGKVYFDPEDANGASTGERYLGNTPGFELAVTTENAELYDNDGPTAEKVEDVATRVDRTANITCNNVSMANLALFVIGDLADQSMTSGSVTDESHTVKTDRWYQLGRSASQPTGAQDIQNFVLTDSGGTTTHVEGTDYEVDLALGRFRPIPGGAITDDTEVLASYDTQAVTWDEISASDAGNQYGALHYIADNSAGENTDLWAPRVNMRPDGSLAWKSRDTWQAMQFAAAFQKTNTYAACYLNGRAV
jgi:hypothetical protein